MRNSGAFWLILVDFVPILQPIWTVASVDTKFRDCDSLSLDGGSSFLLVAFNFIVREGGEITCKLRTDYLACGFRGFDGARRLEGVDTAEAARGATYA